MSKKVSDTNHKGHQTTVSYVTGFILSLIFTAIPYYMVVHKVATGTTLLTIILGFAILQMFVQIFFFLHLGRGPKPLYNVAFFASTVGIIMVVVGGSMFIMKHLHYNMSPQDTTTKLAQDEGIDQVGGAKTGACSDLGINHKVIIKDGKVSSPHTSARLCDTLTFINNDANVRKISFGTYPNHDMYGGEIELSVRKGYPKTITLNQVGTDLLFHDHLDAQVTGSFSVQP